ncbi:hypothetical protein V6N11_021328 [Hibiscus sabdariffa]|uniref:Amino acid transporter transmembrane domain-containing protein n=1 Tax=Hibiscus sabdariffa TaxID=183260 RepID=A0ABR2NM60_9ROSI
MNSSGVAEVDSSGAAEITHAMNSSGVAEIDSSGAAEITHTMDSSGAAEILERQNEVQQQPSNGTNFLRTCFNGLNALSGVGILSIPYALAQGGWLSSVFLFLVAFLCWYTGLLLRRCMDAHPLIKTYPDIGEHAFGYKGRVIVSVFLYVELYLVAVEFLILEGDNMDKLFPNMAFKVAGMTIGGKQAFVILTSLVVLPTTWLKSLGLLAYFSAGGVLASFIIVICIFWIGAVDKVGFNESGVTLNWSGIPIAISFTCMLHHKYHQLRIDGGYGLPNDVAIGGDIAPISVKGGGFLEGTEAIFVDSTEGVVANSDSSGVVLSPNKFEALCNAVVEHEPIASLRKNWVAAAGV